MLYNNCKLFVMEEEVYDRVICKQEEENQESYVEKETECDSVMLKTFHHILCFWVASSD